VPMIPGGDFFDELQKAIIDSWPKPKMLILNFPGIPPVNVWTWIF